jgi:hypothetical protein
MYYFDRGGNVRLNENIPAYARPLFNSDTVSQPTHIGGNPAWFNQWWYNKDTNDYNYSYDEAARTYTTANKLSPLMPRFEGGGYLPRYQGGTAEKKYARLYNALRDKGLIDASKISLEQFRALPKAQHDAYAQQYMKEIGAAHPSQEQAIINQKIAAREARINEARAKRGRAPISLSKTPETVLDRTLTVQQPPVPEPPVEELAETVEEPKSFSTAFREARNAGLPTFKWTNPRTGKEMLYGTELAPDPPPTPSGGPSTTPSGGDYTITPEDIAKANKTLDELKGFTLEHAYTKQPITGRHVKDPYRDIPFVVGAPGSDVERGLTEYRDWMGYAMPEITSNDVAASRLLQEQIASGYYTSPGTMISDEDPVPYYEPEWKTRRQEAIDRTNQYMAENPDLWNDPVKKAEYARLGEEWMDIGPESPIPGPQYHKWAGQDFPYSTSGFLTRLHTGWGTPDAAFTPENIKKFIADPNMPQAERYAYTKMLTDSIPNLLEYGPEFQPRPYKDYMYDWAKDKTMQVIDKTKEYITPTVPGQGPGPDTIRTTTSDTLYTAPPHEETKKKEFTFQRGGYPKYQFGPLWSPPQEGVIAPEQQEYIPAPPPEPMTGQATVGPIVTDASVRPEYNVPFHLDDIVTVDAQNLQQEAADQAKLAQAATKFVGSPTDPNAGVFDLRPGEVAYNPYTKEYVESPYTPGYMGPLAQSEAIQPTASPIDFALLGASQGVRGMLAEGAADALGQIHPALGFIDPRYVTKSVGRIFSPEDLGGGRSAEQLSDRDLYDAYVNRVSGELGQGYNVTPQAYNMINPEMLRDLIEVEGRPSMKGPIRIDLRPEDIDMGSIGRVPAPQGSDLDVDLATSFRQNPAAMQNLLADLFGTGRRTGEVAEAENRFQRIAAEHDLRQERSPSDEDLLRNAGLQQGEIDELYSITDELDQEMLDNTLDEARNLWFDQNPIPEADVIARMNQRVEERAIREAQRQNILTELPKEEPVYSDVFKTGPIDLNIIKTGYNTNFDLGDGLTMTSKDHPKHANTSRIQIRKKGSPAKFLFNYNSVDNTIDHVSFFKYGSKDPNSVKHFKKILTRLPKGVKIIESSLSADSAGSFWGNLYRLNREQPGMFTAEIKGSTFLNELDDIGVKVGSDQAVLRAKGRAIEANNMLRKYREEEQARALKRLGRLVDAGMLDPKALNGVSVSDFGVIIPDIQFKKNFKRGGRVPQYYNMGSDVKTVKPINLKEAFVTDSLMRNGGRVYKRKVKSRR